jgi:hypothetical protein
MPTTEQWKETEIEFCAADLHNRPYETVQMWADFTHTNGTVLKRPAFYDGGNTWRIRFASPVSEGQWHYATFANVEDDGLAGITGTIDCAAASESDHRFYKRGFWHIPKGKRNLRHADDTPALLIGDTAWAIPFRATVEQCEVYANDRQQKGFNAALLMTVQPDRKVQGPRNRTDDEAFEVAFEDLPSGHINQINIAYFQYLDKLIDVLVAHEICPVHQPLFHGYGWKGGDTIGNYVSNDEYARFARYLVARYGARPAIYLIGGDGTGYLDSINAAGREVEEWDCYGQPAGIHYRPHADNRAWQDADWLDFQWCQTGHDGWHQPERVADMWRNEPVKAVANGEPTYENIGHPGNGAGWWQGDEAIRNLCAGGTMGVVYGAGSLWQWKLHKDEPGHAPWCEAEGCGWREALDFEGSNYVGALARVFKDQPFAEMAPNWDCSYGAIALLAPDKFLLVYRPEGGGFNMILENVPKTYTVFDAKTGNVLQSGTLPDDNNRLELDKDGIPKLVVFS